MDTVEGETGLTLVLIHSPLVGPLTWRAVAERLWARGRTALVPELTGTLTHEPPLQPALAAAVAATIGDAAPSGPLVLVGHSGAGPLLPVVANATDRPVGALIYVDALLPQPGKSWFDSAPDDLASRVRHLARDGLLPAWDQWFDPDAISELLADPDLCARFIDELPRLPLTYFQEPAPPADWSGPSGYLVLSDGYADEAAEARARGWPLVELPSHHLAMLTQPDDVADALERLVALLTEV